MRTDVKIGLVVGLALVLMMIAWLIFSPDQGAEDVGETPIAESAPRNDANKPAPRLFGPDVKPSPSPLAKPQGSPAPIPKPVVTDSTVAAVASNDKPFVTPIRSRQPDSDANRTSIILKPPVAETEPETARGPVVVKPIGSTASPTAKTYVVKAGDNGFWTVAKNVYGNGKHWGLISKANPDADSSRLRAGQVLVIPPLPAGPARSGSVQPVRRLAAGEKQYTVKAGDDGFWAVAENAYGNGKYWPLIAKANPGVVSRKLRAGQVLVVPPLNARTGSNAVSPRTIVVNSAAGGKYIVQAGDNGFWTVAKKSYGDGKYQYLIAQANPGVDSNKLRPGQELVVPPKPAQRSAAQRLPRPTRAASADNDDTPRFD